MNDIVQINAEKISNLTGYSIEEVAIVKNTVTICSISEQPAVLSRRYYSRSIPKWKKFQLPNLKKKRLTS